ncbi:uncharacterized protein [Mycetomoellerius zeteki]|uniref:uncharacterized protein n=1 Tax=Mycetomoellerius zeteki TaxID=64791 RepID=UPI00084E9E1E|nr:PREDICTED: uncharacterized protein LOC108729167 [Trachymyrmex zeteki]
MDDDEDISALSEDDSYSDQSEDQNEDTKSKIVYPEEVVALNELTKHKSMDKIKEYVHRKSIERKRYRPLSPSPPSPPPSREKAKYWECPGEKASKSPMSPSTSVKYKSNESAATDAQAIKRR